MAQQSASRPNETTFSTATSRKTAVPPTTDACAMHHGMEKRPAPTTLLIRLTVEERRDELRRGGIEGRSELHTSNKTFTPRW